MNVCQSLICFFFLTLQDGNIGLINAEIIKSTGTEGGNITVRCSFTSSGKRRIFCKDECKDGDILIETEEDTAQIGRYSIECIEGGFPVSKIIVYVSIRNLTQSDSGRYRCGLVRALFSSSYQEIEIRVTDAPTSPLRPSSPSVPSASTLMTSQTSAASSDLPLVLGVCVSVVVVVLAAVLLFLYKKRTKHSDGSNQRGNTDITRTEIDLYENCPPLSTRADSTYQSLDPASRDPDHIYSTLS
ncbi:CMRF35-like molecule 8 [Perca flavescens]|uniref:CMRF35-like molecule 8 n=1 Tax=Perca flavescens TaxID=8167 RepID=UPI00106EC77A|nr:CMRF35-like molecule 8 [Perca flavescens]